MSELAVKDPKLTVETGRFWAGIVATALVAALVGVVGVLVFEKVFDINVISEPTFVASDMGNYAISGALLALLVGLVAYVLVAATPRPLVFFAWIMILLLVVVTVLPLTWTDDLTIALTTGGLNLVVGVAIWSLVASTTRRTTARRSPLDPTVLPGAASAQPQPAPSAFVDPQHPTTEV